MSTARAAMTFALPWEPDIILPAQFQARRAPQLPEHRLLLAVLEDAVDILRKHRHATAWRQHAPHAETWAWLQSTDRDHAFAYETVCEHLGFDAEAVRAKLADCAPRPLLASPPLRPVGGGPSRQHMIQPRILAILRQRGPLRSRQLWYALMVPGEPLTEDAVGYALRSLLGEGLITRDAAMVWRVTGKETG